MSIAIVFDEYGDPDVLHPLEVGDPDPDPHQVRVAVRAAGVQPFDARLRRGELAAFLPVSFPRKLGNEFAGTIDRVGQAVTGVVVGDEVLGFIDQGGYAQHVLVGTDQIVAKPAAMPWEQAGVLSASGQTAATVLADLGVTSGETVLIHAAAGGVGSYAVQLARIAGATVIGTASPANHDYLRQLGATPVTYGDGLVDRVRELAPQGVDAALDLIGGGAALAASVTLVADRDRIGTIADHARAAEFGVRVLGSRRSSAQLAHLVQLWERGDLQIQVSRAYPLEHAAQAHRTLETGHVRGKLVLTVD